MKLIRLAYFIFIVLVFTCDLSAQTEEAWEEYKKKLGDTRPWDVLNPKTEWLSDDDTSKRLDICRSCEFFNNLTKQCKHCGCMMPIKAKMKESACPVGKW